MNDEQRLLAAKYERWLSNTDYNGQLRLQNEYQSTVILRRHG